MKKPGMIRIKGTGKDKSNDVGVEPQKKNSVAIGRGVRLSKENKYTAEFAVPKGTYYVTGVKKKGKYNFKVTTSYFSTLKSGQKISWKQKTSAGTGARSDLNNLFYRIKPSKSGYISFDVSKGSVDFIILYDKNMKAISQSRNNTYHEKYFAVEKNKEYYVGIIPPYKATSYKLQYRLTKASNQAGKSKSKAVELGTKKKSCLFYAKEKNSVWFKYKVTEEMTHHTYIAFKVDDKMSNGAFTIDVYKGSEKIYEDYPNITFGGGAKIKASDVEAGDVLYINLQSSQEGALGKYDPISDKSIDSCGSGYCKIWVESE